jgi:tetratricopeptide (TPR) repeat protein
VERRIEKTVFLSYRRTNFAWALAIFQDLTHHGFDVFFDYKGIASGAFERVIIENIQARAHFLVLLTPSALKRCADPKDWLRREIEKALETRRNIVPLTLKGFDFGKPSIDRQLTGGLAVLKEYNALSIPREFFWAAMDRLRNEYLNIPLDAVLHPPSMFAKSAATEQKTAAEAAPEVKPAELTAEEWFERGFDAEDPQEKLHFYSQAIRQKPDWAEAFLNRGVAHYQSGNPEGAELDYNEVLRLTPDLAEAFINRGNARRAKGDMDGALRDFEEAIRLKPGEPLAFNNRASALKANGDLEGAIWDYTEAIRLAGEDAHVFLCNRGNALEDKGDREGALQDYTEAIRLKPDYAVAFSSRGVARKAQGDLDGALRDYSEAIRLKSDDSNVFYNRANARAAKGDMDGALEDYTDAVRLNPEHALAFNNRALARATKGDLEGALEDMAAAARLGLKHQT